MGRKGDLAGCGWERRLAQPLRKTVWRHPPKLKREPPYDPAPCLPGTDLRETESLSPVHGGILRRSHQLGKRPKCPRRRSGQSCGVGTHNGTLFSLEKAVDPAIRDHTDGPEGQRDISQTQKERCSMTRFSVKSVNRRRRKVGSR